MRYIDLQWAFPNFIIAVYLVAVFGTGLSNVIVAVSLAFVDDFARIARGMVLSIKEEQYVAAARVVGASDWRIMWRHILPNTTRADHRPGDGQRLLRDPGRGRAVVPGPRRRVRHADLGPDPGRCPQLHLARLVARRVPRPVHHDHRALDQFPGRRAARPARRARGQGPGARVISPVGRTDRSCRRGGRSAPPSSSCSCRPSPSRSGPRTRPAELVDGARPSRTAALAEDVEAQRGAVPLDVARRAARERIVGAQDRERGAVRALVRDTDRRPAGGDAAQHVRQLEARLDLVSARLQQRLALLRVRDEGRHSGSHEGANGAKDRSCALPAAVAAKKPSTTDRDLMHDPAGQEREKAVRRP